MLRPVRFVQADEDVFRANAKAFADKTGVEVKVDFVGWEDINQQTAVTSNSGAGPDIIIGFTDSPHIYVDKIIELTDVADYLGKRYGGWLFLAEKYGKRHKSNTWIGLPFGATSGPLVYRKSLVQAAGFERVPDDHAGFLALCQKLKAAASPPALRSATPSATATALQAGCCGRMAHSFWMRAETSSSTARRR
jgi:multiple sugar transport system substrate-binding protein